MKMTKAASARLLMFWVVAAAQSSLWSGGIRSANAGDLVYPPQPWPTPVYVQVQIISLSNM